MTVPDLRLLDQNCQVIHLCNGWYLVTVTATGHSCQRFWSVYFGLYIPYLCMFASLVLTVKSVIDHILHLGLFFQANQWMSTRKEWYKFGVSLSEIADGNWYSLLKVRLRFCLISCRYILISCSREFSDTINITVKIRDMNLYSVQRQLFWDLFYPLALYIDLVVSSPVFFIYLLLLILKKFQLSHKLFVQVQSQSLSFSLAKSRCNYASIVTSLCCLFHWLQIMSVCCWIAAQILPVSFNFEHHLSVVLGEIPYIFHQSTDGL